MAPLAVRLDVIVYDAMNSPVYRTGTRLQILPRDNVAAVIEVKSKLNKEELRDAAGYVQRNHYNTHLGMCVRVDSYTSMETLAENLDEINGENDQDCWIDLVVVLDKGCIGYALQNIFGEFVGWLADLDSREDFPVPPFYVHVAESEVGEKALDHFFVRLIAHLTFFRKISAVDLETISGATSGSVEVIRGYQYTLKGKLVPTEARHQAGCFENPKVRFNLYFGKTRQFAGQLCLLPWQDGFVITLSTAFDPNKLFAHLLTRFGLRGQLLRCKHANSQIIWTSHRSCPSPKKSSSTQHRESRVI